MLLIDDKYETNLYFLLNKLQNDYDKTKLKYSTKRVSQSELVELKYTQESIDSIKYCQDSPNNSLPMPKFFDMWLKRQPKSCIYINLSKLYSAHKKLNDTYSERLRLWIQGNGDAYTKCVYAISYGYYVPVIYNGELNN